VLCCPVSAEVCGNTGLFLVLLQSEHDNGNVVGLDHTTGDPMDPNIQGIFDNYSVKRQIINSA
jgi:T-complex protein 1 subunit zeta